MAAQQICNDGRTSAILRFAKLYLAALLQKLAGDMAERPVARKPGRQFVGICFCIIDQTFSESMGPVAFATMMTGALPTRTILEKSR